MDINLVRELLESYIRLMGKILDHFEFEDKRYGPSELRTQLLNEIKSISQVTNETFTPKNIGGKDA